MNFTWGELNCNFGRPQRVMFDRWVFRRTIRRAKFRAAKTNISVREISNKTIWNLIITTKRSIFTCSIRPMQTDRTCWSIQIQLDELNWFKNRTQLELNSLSGLLKWSSTFELDLTETFSLSILPCDRCAYPFRGSSMLWSGYWRHNDLSLNWKNKIVMLHEEHMKLGNDPRTTKNVICGMSCVAN